MDEPKAVAPHLARLGAAPRPAGSAAAIAARGYCRTVLADLGFEISEHSFEYSEFSGKWATPMFGVLIPAFAMVMFLTRSTSPWWIILSFTATSLTAIWAALLQREGVLSLPFMRRRGVNIQAIRGGEPRVWLVAHIDSKWQPVSMTARILGVLGTAVALIGLLLAGLFWPASGSFWLVVLWVASIPLMLSVVGARNHGTLDNASGVAAVLSAAERLEHDVRVGVLITDAEELALAGARAWAPTRRPVVALNCDSVDDDGPLIAMYSGPMPRTLVSQLKSAALDQGERLRTLRLIPGVLTDHVPLAEAGWTTLTLSRGTVRTLRRIHTSHDTLAHMDGRGISGAAKVLARLVTELS